MKPPKLYRWVSGQEYLVYHHDEDGMRTAVSVDGRNSGAYKYCHASEFSSTSMVIDEFEEDVMPEGFYQGSIVQQLKPYPEDTTPIQCKCDFHTVVMRYGCQCGGK